MMIEWTDFNLADEFLENVFPEEWSEVYSTLDSMPIHLKASDQKGIQGSPIFDAIGTNNFVKSSLLIKSWVTNCPIPRDFSFLGKDIDFFKSGVLIEVQFSNYPFLLNNLLRSELFYKSRSDLGGEYPKTLIVITKARMFPSSNSTLYYEQAVSQINALTQHDVFDIPIRVVGLFAPLDQEFQTIWTTYHNMRSRTIASQITRNARVLRGRGTNARYSVEFTND